VKILTWDENGNKIIRDMTADEIAEADARTPAVPVSVSRFQAKAAMLQAGLLDQVELLIAGGDAVTQLAWAEAVEYRRDSPLINSLAAAMDMTAEQVDDLFIAAGQVSV
jgi:hypothetical protein